MNKYRTHNCSELNEKNIGIKIKLSGWIHRKRDHGNLLFIDIRDHFGITQCVIEHQDKNFKTLEKLRPCLLYTSPSPRDRTRSRMPSSA